MSALPAELVSELWMLVMLWSSWSTYDDVTWSPRVSAAWLTVSWARAATAALAESLVTSLSLACCGLVPDVDVMAAENPCGMVSTP